MGGREEGRKGEGEAERVITMHLVTSSCNTEETHPGLCLELVSTNSL